MRIIFIGTGALGIPVLECLSDSSHDVALVVTQPDHRRGRYRRRRMPIPGLAADYGLPVAAVDGVNRPEAVAEILGARPDAILVVAFGQKICRALLDGPPHGCLNVHPSLLPKYRGAAPVQWALISGDAETGVSILRLDEGMDTGDILAQRSTEIEPDESADELESRLAWLAGPLVVKTLDGLEAGNVRDRPQKGAPSLAPKIASADGLISWDDSPLSVHNFIRAMTSHPGASTYLRRGDEASGGLLVQIRRTRLVEDAESSQASGARPGTILQVDAKRNRILVACRDAPLAVKELKPAGGLSMRAAAFLNGHHVAPGMRFERS